MTFKVLSTTAKNSATVGDRFIIEDGERTIQSITNRFVILDNQYRFYKKQFNRWLRIENAMITKTKIIKAKQAIIPPPIIKTIIETDSLNSTTPVNNLRYIVVYNYTKDIYHWVFAQRHTSHSNMEEEFLKSTQDDCQVRIGGFYYVEPVTVIVKSTGSDTYNEEQHYKLHFFGESGSYGCHKATFLEALPSLSLKDTEIEYTLMDRVWEKNGDNLPF